MSSLSEFVVGQIIKVTNEKNAKTKRPSVQVSILISKFTFNSVKETVLERRLHAHACHELTHLEKNGLLRWILV